MTSRLERTALVALAVVAFATATMTGTAFPQALDVSTLREQVNAHLAVGEYARALELLEPRMDSSNRDNEMRQYALLTYAEIHLIYLGEPEESIAPLRTLIEEYFADSPYVASARYHLGSLYMDRGDAVNSFTQLAQVPSSSKHYSDAQLKLDWASKNLRNVVSLPMGLEVGVRRLGTIALVADVIFTLLWVTQAVLSKGKNKVVWIILIVLALAKIGISMQLTRFGA